MPRKYKPTGRKPGRPKKETPVKVKEDQAAPADPPPLPEPEFIRDPISKPVETEMWWIG